MSEADLSLYELGLLLHMPVYRILTEMPYEELLGWQEYFEKRPAGWREDQRAAMIMQAFGVKTTPDKLFSSLARMKTSAIEVSKEGVVSVSTFKQSGVFHFLAGTDLPPALK